MVGNHTLGTLERCKLTRPRTTFLRIEQIITQNGLTIVGKKLHIFPNKGFTCFFMLAESHIAIHTWPEHNNRVYVDVFVCTKRHSLFSKVCKLFEPRKVVVKSLQR